MPLYVTLRAGPSPATSVPLLVIADQRLIHALMDELVRMAGVEEDDDVRPSAPFPARSTPAILSVPCAPSVPLGSSTSQRGE